MRLLAKIPRKASDILENGDGEDVKLEMMKCN